MVREGDVVKKGQVVALLNSTELTSVQFSFLKAYSQATLLERAVDRAQQLLEAGVIGSAELQRRQAELAQATAEAATLRGQLKVLGMPEEAANNLEKTRKVDATSQIVASIGGIVLERRATVGQVIQPSDTIFVLADLSRVWLVADVPEQTAGNLAEGEQVEAEIPSLPGQKVRGRLSHVHSILNPETRTVRVHMDVDNPRGRLKPAMLATMTLREPGAVKRVVPITAIVREERGEFVFVQKSPKTVVMREVKLGNEFENMRVLESGLEPKEKLVLDGAFHLNNERKRLALQKGGQ
jgi:cobalt-zinc-cadmium efflux system membrane fusion protein